MAHPYLSSIGATSSASPKATKATKTKPARIVRGPKARRSEELGPTTFDELLEETSVEETSVEETMSTGTKVGLAAALLALLALLRK